MVVRSQMGVYQKVAVTARYRRRGTGSLKVAVYSALAAVVGQHPILSAIPEGVDTAAPYFARLPSVDLDQVVTVTEVDGFRDVDGRFPDLDRFLQREHDRPWEYTRPPSPFWRVHLLHERGDSSRFTLCFMFHHCLCDTKSALVFHDAVETALNGLVDVESTNPVRPPDLPLLPPMDIFVKSPVETSGSSNQEQLSSVWTGAAQFLPVQTRFTSRWLSAEQTRRLIDGSKQRGLSLTSTLQAMIVAAVFEQLPGEYTTLTTDCAVSLRGWFPSPVTAQSMGSFVDTFTQVYHRSPFSWEEARRTRDTIDKVVKQQRGDDLVGKLSRIPDLKAWTEAKMGHARSSSIEMSNVGRLAPSTATDDYQIEGLLFSQSAGACSGAIKVCAVTGRDGRLNLGFTWQEGVVEETMIHSVVAGFTAILGREQ